MPRELPGRKFRISSQTNASSLHRNHCGIRFEVQKRRLEFQNQPHSNGIPRIPRLTGDRFDDKKTAYAFSIWRFSSPKSGQACDFDQSLYR
jgi:hypothetical protein